MDMLDCTKCNTAKPVSAFSRSTNHKRGYQYYCKSCQADYNKGHYRGNPQPYRDRARQRVQGRPWVRHGLTDEAWEALLQRSGGFCEVCRERPFEVIDHDHDCHPGGTGCARCVRGLLCGACNLMLGFARDNPEVLQRGAAYLS